MASQNQNNSIKLRHLMTSSSFMNMELANYIAGHKHGPACGHSCGHDHDEAEYSQDVDQDGAIGE